MIVHWVNLLLNLEICMLQFSHDLNFFLCDPLKFFLGTKQIPAQLRHLMCKPTR